MIVSQVIALINIIGIGIISALIGAWALRKGKKTAHDYYVAGGTLGSLVLSLSVIASIISYVTFMGNASLGYRTGLAAIIIMGTPGIPQAFAWWVFHRKTYLLGKAKGWRSIGAVWDARYGEGMGSFIAWVLLATTMPWLAAQIQATGFLMSILSLPYWTGTIFVLAFILFYMVLGGFRGTSYVHVFQTLALSSGAIVFFAIALIKIGGLTKVGEVVVSTKPHLFQIGAQGGKVWSYPMMFSYGLSTITGFTCMPVAFLHTYACRKLRALKVWAFSFGVATLLLTLMMVLLGIIGVYYLPALKGMEIEKLYPKLAYLLMPEWLATIVIALMVAAGMSTIDSIVFGNATNIINDWYCKIAKGHSEGYLIWAGRIVMILLVIIGGILTAIPKIPLAELNVLSFSATGMMFFGLVGGYIWRGATRAGALSSILVGVFLVYFLSLVWPGQGPGPSPALGGLTPFLIAFPISGVVFVLVSLLTRKREEPPGVKDIFSIPY
jgi:SSS family solute:Na+ symporter